MARRHRWGERPAGRCPKSFFGVELVETDPFYFYYAALPIMLLGMWAAWRIVHSPFGRVLVAIRDNPARARALGYDVETLQGHRVRAVRRGSPVWPAGCSRSATGSRRCQELHWTTSGKVVLVTVLGGIGTLWGGIAGAFVIVTIEDQLASSGFEGIGIITGSVFILVVLLFRRGIWGTVRHLWISRRGSKQP